MLRARITNLIVGGVYLGQVRSFDIVDRFPSSEELGDLLQVQLAVDQDFIIESTAGSLTISAKIVDVRYTEPPTGPATLEVFNKKGF